MYKSICQSTYDLEPIQKLISSNEKFDVVLVEYFANSCFLGITWKLQAPVIGLSSCALPPWHFDSIGSPIIPSFMPSLFTQYSDKMTFMDRFYNYINVYGMKFLHQTLINSYTNTFLRQQFGEAIPPIDELERNASLIFLNQHYSVTGAKPFLPSIVEIGGIHMKDEKPLEPVRKRNIYICTNQNC